MTEDHDSRSYLKNIIDNVADPIFVKDRKHRWVDGNKAFFAIMARSEKDVGDTAGRNSPPERQGRR